MRLNSTEEFALIFDEVKRRASQIGVELAVPQLVGRQIHRANTPADNPQEYFRRTIMIPVLDNMITELEERFSEQQCKVVQLLNLVPVCIAYAGFKTKVPEKLKDLIMIYIIHYTRV